MNRINCSGEGCEAYIETLEPVSNTATYSCRVHTGKDTKNQDLRFQAHQFDKSLSRGASPSLGDPEDYGKGFKQD